MYFDLDSPETKNKTYTIEEQMTRSLDMKTIENEFSGFYSVLLKSKGRDIVKTKQKARSKLVPEQELEEVLDKLKEKVSEFNLIAEEDFKTMNEKDVLKVRNALIAIATLRLGRRTKEIITLQIEEVDKAVVKVVDGEEFRVVEVLEQKNLKSGELAPIAYTTQEFILLQTYIKFLRPKLSSDESVKNVFINGKTSKTPILSFSSVHSILQNFKTSSGKKLGSRIIRCSKITNSRDLDLSHQEQLDLARSMSHTLPTADKHYNHKALGNSLSKKNVS